MIKDERNMKKTLLASMLLLAMVFSFASCGTKTVDLSEADLSQYVQLGDYLGVAVEVDAEKAVTDEDVKAVVNALLDKKATETSTPVTDRAAAEGDTLTIDFVGKMGGTPFEGGSATDATITLGEGTYIDGFEEGLVGANVGDVVTLNLTFPEEYKLNPDYAGKAAEFEVTVKEINVITKTLPEYTDEFVAENTDYETIADYEAATRTTLEETAASTYQNAVNSAVWKAVAANAEVKSLPQANVDSYIATMKEYYEYIRHLYAKNYGISEENAAILVPIDEDEIRRTAETNITNDILMYAIASAQNWQLTDDEYAEGGLKYAKKYNYDTVEELFANTSVNEKNLKKALLWDKVLKNLTAAAKVTDK